jgi:hypothetical protein
VTILYRGRQAKHLSTCARARQSFRLRIDWTDHPPNDGTSKSTSPPSGGVREDGRPPDDGAPSWQRLLRLVEAETVGLPTDLAEAGAQKTSSGVLRAFSARGHRTEPARALWCMWTFERHNLLAAWHLRSGASGAGRTGSTLCRLGRPTDGRNPLAGDFPKKDASFTPAGQRQEGQALRKEGSAAWEGKPLKVEPHRRYRRETKPEGFREEQRAMRLRKPVGAAQPGEANLVWVASRCLKRQRGQEPQGGSCFGNRSPWVIL